MVKEILFETLPLFVHARARNGMLLIFGGGQRILKSIHFIWYGADTFLRAAFSFLFLSAFSIK